MIAWKSFAPWFHHENTASLDLASKGCERAYGARGESRTHTPSRAEDFESPASAIPPLGHIARIILAQYLVSNSEKVHLRGLIL